MYCDESVVDLFVSHSKFSSFNLFVTHRLKMNWVYVLSPGNPYAVKEYFNFIGVAGAYTRKTL